MSAEAEDDGDLLDPGFRSRLAEIVDVIGGNVAAGEVAGVKRGTVHEWKQGRGRIPLAAAVSLARAAHKSVEWLIEGRQAETGFAPSPLMRLDGPDSPLPDSFVAVPMLRITASAGPGRFAMADETRSSDAVAFPEEWLRMVGLSPGRTDALTAFGDSMEPTIRDGDMLLIDRSIDRVVDNGIYVVVFGGAVLVKRVHIRRDRSVVLRSENTVYPEEVVPADEVPDLVVEGRVRWFGRTI